jgi:hypothetical protein
MKLQSPLGQLREWTGNCYRVYSLVTVSVWRDVGVQDVHKTRRLYTPISAKNRQSRGGV